MGYRRCITYTQADECGASLRAVGWVRVKELDPRGSWAESSQKMRAKRDPVGNGGVARSLGDPRMTTCTRCHRPLKRPPIMVGDYAFGPQCARDVRRQAEAGEARAGAAG